MLYDPIKDHGHRSLKVAKMADFKVCLLHQCACNQKIRLWYSRTICKFYLDWFLIFIVVRRRVTFKPTGATRSWAAVQYRTVLLLCDVCRYMRWISSELCTVTPDLLKTCFRTLLTASRSLCWVMPALCGWSVFNAVWSYCCFWRFGSGHSQQVKYVNLLKCLAGLLLWTTSWVSVSVVTSNGLYSTHVNHRYVCLCVDHRYGTHQHFSSVHWWRECSVFRNHDQQIPLSTTRMPVTRCLVVSLSVYLCICLSPLLF